MNDSSAFGRKRAPVAQLSEVAAACLPKKNLLCSYQSSLNFNVTIVADDQTLKTYEIRSERVIV